MDRVSVCILWVVLFLTLLMVSSEQAQVTQALVEFMIKLSPGNLVSTPNFGWNVSSDPCKGKWMGVSCNRGLVSVRKIVLNQFNLNGVLDAASLCKTSALLVLSLIDNNLSGEIPSAISNCQNLTHLYLSGNRFSGSVPASLIQLGNLKRLDISQNYLSGQLPDLSIILGLLSFFAQNNQLTGEIPNSSFVNLLQFNVSNNNLIGLIPGNLSGHFNSDSFLGNPQLCGKPLLNICPKPPPPPPLLPPPPDEKTKNSSIRFYLLYSGYGVIGLALALFVGFKLFKRKKATRKEDAGSRNKGVELDSTKNMTNDNSGRLMTGRGRYKSEYSIRNSDSDQNSLSLVVLSSGVVNELKFDELLKAPAELIGRGKNGSLFKVMLDGGVNLAVKRIKNIGIMRDDFKKRMKRMDQVKHRNVLPVVAYYSSKQEKLLVYEFQQNGSLFNLLHESQQGRIFDWGSRIRVADGVAQALAFMHEELRSHGIAHGNLKSSNILFNNDMDPCISEYGATVVEGYHDRSSLSKSNSIKSIRSDVPPPAHSYSTFKVDIYRFGVILLELLTGKIVQNGGFDLGAWVQEVVSNEWTVEVFDKALLLEGANEEAMVNLLHMALKCIKPSPDDRPSIDEIAALIKSIKEEEERSVSYEPSDQF